MILVKVKKITVIQNIVHNSQIHCFFVFWFVCLFVLLLLLLLLFFFFSFFLYNFVIDFRISPQSSMSEVKTNSTVSIDMPNLLREMTVKQN